MSELFGRTYKLNVPLWNEADIFGNVGFIIDSSIQDPPLDIDFTVIRTTTKEPNTADIKVYNLSPENRANLETLREAQVELFAGYGSDIGMIFKGDVEINNQPVFPDWISFLEADDGGKSIRFDRVNLSFKGGVDLATVIKGIAGKMRVGIGNSVQAALRGNLVDAGKQFLNGVTVSGSAPRQLNRLTKSSGLEWSIQNGDLQLLEKGKPLPQIAVLLNEETGLIGSPAAGNEDEITFRSLMNKDIVPGGLIALQSESLSGQFRAEKCTYTGVTRGNDWYVDVEAKVL